MKRCIYAVCLILVFCLFFYSCSKPSGLNTGFDGIWAGKLPDVHFGVKSDDVEFDIDNATLEFSYGNETSDIGGYIGNYVSDGDYFEECPIVCVAVYFFNSKYIDTLDEARFEDYKNIEGFHFVKEISLDDYNENYGVENNFFGRRYEHSETLTIPEEVMEFNTGYACLGVYSIAYIPSEDMYRFGYHGYYQALKYEKLDNGKVKISEPVGSHYADPKN